MADNLTKEQRSRNMSLIKSKWTAPEKKIHAYLKGRKIKHRMHPKLDGNPDVILKNSNTAIFLHGCFWHKCPRCYKKPKSNEVYWQSKIEANVKRDRKNCRILKRAGWKTIIIWEHEIKNNWTEVKNKF